MNMNLAHIDPKTEPHRFASACVLSPDDPDMDASAAAVKAIKAELHRLTGVQTEWAAARRVKCKAALANIERRRGEKGK